MTFSKVYLLPWHCVLCVQACCRKLYNWLKVAPYQVEQQMDDDYDLDDNDSGIRVLGIAYVAEK